MTGKQPNILFITCHDLGRHLGCYGQPTVASPNLDGLAARGVQFTNAFSTAPVCCPARAGLHTGRYPHATGMLGFVFAPFNWSLNKDERHLASHLQQLGYKTAQIGVQHVVKPDRTDLVRNLGFDYATPVKPNAAAAEVAREARDFLSTRQHDQPFYLELGFFEPHTRWEQYPMIGWGETEIARGIKVPDFLPDQRATRAQFAGFQGAVRQLDEGIGEVLEALENTGQADNTWIIFTTDHGIPFPGAKGTLYDPGIETSLIMHWPQEALAGGTVHSQLISNVDVTPTILEALGIPIPEELQGHSFWPLLKQSNYLARDHICAEHTFGIHYEPTRCVRTSNHKLVFIPEMSPGLGSETDGVYNQIYHEYLGVRPYFRRPIFELYDLRADPLERINLAGHHDYIETEQALIRKLHTWMKETRDPLLHGPIASPRYVEALEALEQTGRAEA